MCTVTLRGIYQVQQYNIIIKRLHSARSTVLAAPAVVTPAVVTESANYLYRRRRRRRCPEPKKHDTADQLLEETVPRRGSDHMLALVVVVAQHYTHPVESWRPSPLEG